MENKNNGKDKPKIPTELPQADEELELTEGAPTTDTPNATSKQQQAQTNASAKEPIDTTEAQMIVDAVNQQAVPKRSGCMWWVLALLIAALLFCVFCWGGTCSRQDQAQQQNTEVVTTTAAQPNASK